MFMVHISRCKWIKEMGISPALEDGKSCLPFENAPFEGAFFFHKRGKGERY